MTRSVRPLAAVFLVVAVAAGTRAELPLGTEFTYQGRLAQGGQAVNGTVSMTVRLFDSATDGVLLATMNRIVPVDKGLFQIALDFGSAYFSGQGRWLELEVDGVTLAPRQAITAVPYALKVPGVDGHALHSATGAYPNAVFVNHLGRVGIGTTAPIAALHVAGGSNPRLRIQDTGASGAEYDMVVNSGDGSLRFGRVGVGERLTIESTGNIGIGTTSPANPAQFSRVLTVRGNTGAAAFPGSAAVVLENPLGTPWSLGLTSSATHYLNVLYGDTFRSRFSVDGAHGTFEVLNSSGNAMVRLLSNGGGGVGRVQILDAGGSAQGSFFVQNVDQSHISADGASSGVKFFSIDHPIDPENYFLYHATVESPEMKNIYDGIAVTGPDGYATIALPEYFEALNESFRYQLTVLDDGDDFVLAKVVREVADNQFLIRTSRPQTTVSWQVTGVRRDPLARKYAFDAEMPKIGVERGRYLNPEVYGNERGAPLTRRAPLPISEAAAAELHEAPAVLEQ